jgi:hypothetical protein
MNKTSNLGLLVFFGCPCPYKSITISQMVKGLVCFLLE